MFGIGTIVNTLAVIVGGFLGLILKRKINEQMQMTITIATGVGILFLSILGVIQASITIHDGQMITSGTMISIVSLCVGGLLGEWFQIDKLFDRFGTKIKSMFHQEGDQQFQEAFLTTTFTICIGAMAIVGSIQDGLLGQPNTLFAKAFLDFVIVMIFAASLGKGSMFAAIPLFIFQGSITVLSHMIAQYISNTMLNNLNIVGNMLIFCVGLNLLFPKKVKVASLLPALIVAMIFGLF